MKKNKIQQPLLSIIVPTYNCGGPLKKGVDSLANHPLLYLIEIIIINDGSTDNSLQVAKQLKKKYRCVSIVDKKNGGHGSTINVGIKKAKGKYFRLMDADDYFNTTEFVKFLKRLEIETADVVLTDYSEIDAVSGLKKIVRHYDRLPKYRRQKIDLASSKKGGFRTFGPLLPTTTCKTELLKQAEFEIDENCFYVDMEYNFITYSQAETIVYYPLEIYQYVLGRESQSVSVKSRKKNFLQHERVCFRLLDEYSKKRGGYSVKKRDHLRDRLVAPVCDWHYYTIIYYLKSREEFLKFDKKLKKYEEFYNHKKVAGKAVRLLRALNGRGLKLVVFFSKKLDKK